MKTYLRELIWLVATLLVTLLIFYFVDGFQNRMMDINLHDTYFVIGNHLVLLILFSVFIFSVYLVRVIAAKAKNKTANIIFLIVNSLAIFTSASITLFQRSYGGWTIYPPMSKLPSQEGIKVFDPLFWIFLAITSVLILLEGIIAYKTLKK